MIKRLLVLGIFACTEAAAQNDAQATIPRQLALSVVHFQNVGSYGYFGPGGGDAGLSTDVPRDLLAIVTAPLHGSFTGAVIWPRMTDAFGVADGSVQDVRAWFTDEFKRRRYSVTNDQTQMLRFGGFRDPEPGPVSGGGGYCAKGDLVNADVLPIDPRHVEFRVRLTREHQNCRDNAPRGRGPAFVDAPDYPTLYNPANASQVQMAFTGCRDQEFGSSGTSTTLTTSMSPTELIKHYDRQMASAGWKSLQVPSSATSTWSKRDTSGNETILTLTVTAGRQSPNCRQVDLRIIGTPSRIK